MAVAAPSISPRGTAPARILGVYMLDLPFGIDGPARDHVHLSHRERSHRDIHLGRATLGEHLVAGRLYIAGFVPGATLYAIHINLTHNLLASIGQDVWPITLSATPKRPILTF